MPKIDDFVPSGLAKYGQNVVETPKRNAFGAGLSAGVDELQGLGYGLGGAVADVVGAEKVRDWMNQRAAMNQQEAQQNGRPDLENIEDQTLASAGPYLAYQVSKQVPMMAGVMAGGALMPEAVIPAFAARAAATAPRFVGGGGLKAGADFATRYAAIKQGGNLVGGTYIGAGMGAGSMYNESVEAGSPDAARALALSPIYGAAEAMVPGAVHSMLRRGGSGFAGNLLARTGKAAGVTALGEAGTETLQNEMEMSFNPNLTDEQKFSRRLNSAVAGGLVGGSFGSLGGIRQSVDARASDGAPVDLLGGAPQGAQLDMFSGKTSLPPQSVTGLDFEPTGMQPMSHVGRQGSLDLKVIPDVSLTTQPAPLQQRINEQLGLSGKPADPDQRRADFMAAMAEPMVDREGNPMRVNDPRTGQERPLTVGEYYHISTQQVRPDQSVMGQTFTPEDPQQVHTDPMRAAISPQEQAAWDQHRAYLDQVGAHQQQLRGQGPFAIRKQAADEAARVSPQAGLFDYYQEAAPEQQAPAEEVSVNAPHPGQGNLFDQRGAPTYAAEQSAGPDWGRATQSAKMEFGIRTKAGKTNAVVQQAVQARMENRITEDQYKEFMNGVAQAPSRFKQHEKAIAGLLETTNAQAAQAPAMQEVRQETQPGAVQDPPDVTAPAIPGSNTEQVPAKPSRLETIKAAAEKARAEKEKTRGKDKNASEQSVAAAPVDGEAAPAGDEQGGQPDRTEVPRPAGERNRKAAPTQKVQVGKPGLEWNDEYRTNPAREPEFGALSEDNQRIWSEAVMDGYASQEIFDRLVLWHRASKFSREMSSPNGTDTATDDDAAAYSKNDETTSTPVLEEKFRETLVTLNKGLDGAVAVEGVWSPEELPESVKKDAEAAGVPLESIKGVLAADGKSIYIVGSAHESVAEVEETVLHEVYGHLGVHKLFGKAVYAKLSDLYSAMGKDNFLALAAKYKVDVSGYSKSAALQAAKNRITAARAGGQTELFRGILMDELLAHIASSKQNAWAQRAKEIIGAVRQWLRDHGFAKLAEYGETDLLHVLEQSRGALANPAEGGAQAFSVKEAATEETTTPKDDSATTKFLDGVKNLVGDRGREMAREFMTLRQLETSFGDKFSSLKHYATAAFKMGATAEHAMIGYAKVQQAITSLPQAQQDKLFDLMTNSTLAGIHPNVSLNDDLNKHVTEPDKQAQWIKLNAQWQQLDPKAKNAYIAARDEFKNNWQKRIDLMDKKMNEFLSAGDLAHWTEEKARWSKQLSGPYFPLMRFGRWVVVYKSKEYAEAEATNDTRTMETLKSDPKAYRVEFMDGKTQAERLADSWRSNGAKAYIQRHTEYEQAVDGVNRTMLNKLEETLADRLPGAEAKETIKTVRELYAMAMPEYSAMKRTLARRNVHGVKSADMMRSLSRAGIADSYYLARLEHADELALALQDMHAQDKADNGGDGSLYNLMVKRHAASMKYVDTPIQNMLTNLTYVNMLGSSPAFMLINGLQPFMVTLPFLGARHGVAKSSAGLAKATADAGRVLKVNLKEQGWNFGLDFDAAKDAGNKMGLAPDEREMLQGLLDSGLIDITVVSDLASIAGGNNLKLDKAMKMATTLPQYVEVVNRVATALAAYRLEKTALKETGTSLSKNAAKYAEKAVADTQLDYSSVNTAYQMMPGGKGFAAPVARLVYQFRKYQQGMVWLLANNFGKALKGDKEAQRMLFGLLATHGAMAGAAGLPIAFPVAVLAKILAQAGDDDDEIDPNSMWRNFLADIFGIEGGRAVAKGLPSLVNIDLSGRVGLGNVFNPLPQVEWRGSMSDTYKEMLAGAVAPSLANIGNYLKATDEWSKGNWTKGLESALPKMLADPLKAMRFDKEGVTTKAGNVALESKDLDAWDIAQRALGLSSTKFTEYYDAKSEVEAADRRIKDVRNQLLDKYIKARREGDQGSLSELQDDVKEFNSRHTDKTTRITMSTLLHSWASREKYTKQTNDAGIRVEKGKDWKNDMSRYAAQ